MPEQTVTVLVKSCQRCGKDHEAEFATLLNAVDHWTHWGMCPNTKQPVLMRFGLSEPPSAEETPNVFLPKLDMTTYQAPQINLPPGEAKANHE